jgi:4a-hydroxytetrahydrobiopterin dehydratase
MQTYSEADAKTKLAEMLTHWRVEGPFLTRRYRTYGWKGTLMVVNAIGHLAEAAWHHPELKVGYATVEVQLQSHDAGGITDRDFELARKIEDVVHWQPKKAKGALTGTPTGQANGYIKYDD